MAKRKIKLEPAAAREPVTKSTDEVACEIKEALVNRLQEVVNIFNNAHKFGFALGFNIKLNAEGVYEVVDLKLTKNF